MRVVIDTEADGLNPTKIWVIVCKDIDTNIYYIFRRPSDDELACKDFETFIKKVKLWVGHNLLDYDLPAIRDILGLDLLQDISILLDTLVLSKLINYSRDGHSLDDYGYDFDLPKVDFQDYSKYSLDLENRCVRDVDINHKVFSLYERQVLSRNWKSAIRCEQQFQLISSDISRNGFAFNVGKANLLLAKVKKELDELDEHILECFPPSLECIRQTIPGKSRAKIIRPKEIGSDPGSLDTYSRDPNCLLIWKHFNPRSHKQIVDVLRDAGWRPIDKTKTHIETLRQSRHKSDDPNIKKKLDNLSQYGYKINDINLNTLPSTAPPPARTLAKRILLESRRRTLVEWLGLATESDTGPRIHGKFLAIGTWTHRMSHQKPNMANIPNTHDTNGNIKLLGGDMRSLFIAPKKRLLVGVDAESIQLRIFAHYINDKEFTDALVRGSKLDKTDPHSINQKILGRVCKSRAAAKRFIYALLLGAGMRKLSEVLECSDTEAEEALSNLLRRYEGFAYLKRTLIPRDAKRGYFIGLDGREVPIYGETVDERRHLAMSGYLQNGEAVIMKYATIDVYPKLKDYNALLVDLVHDEWQTEVPNGGIHEYAIPVAELYCQALERTGQKLKLKCPLKGSYWSDEYNDYTIGTNWKVTH